MPDDRWQLWSKLATSKAKKKLATVNQKCWKELIQTYSWSVKTWRFRPFLWYDQLGSNKMQTHLFPPSPRSSSLSDQADSLSLSTVITSLLATVQRRASFVTPAACSDSDYWPAALLKLTACNWAIQRKVCLRERQPQSRQPSIIDPCHCHLMRLNPTITQLPRKALMTRIPRTAPSTLRSQAQTSLCLLVLSFAGVALASRPVTAATSRYFLKHPEPGLYYLNERTAKTKEVSCTVEHGVEVNIVCNNNPVPPSQLVIRNDSNGKFFMGKDGWFYDN